MAKPTLAIDWDATLVKGAWPKQTKEWQPGAVDALRELVKFARVVIHTSRIAPMEIDGFTPRPLHLVEGEVQYIRDMLDSVGLRQVEIHDFRTMPWKPAAQAYVDDKAVRYSGRPNAWRHLTRKLTVMCGQDYKEDDGDV